MSKIIVYLFVIPFVFWALDGVSIKNIFKKNRIYQAWLLYFFIAVSLSYIVVQFLYDFIYF